MKKKNNKELDGFVKQFGDNLRQLREKAGITQEGMAGGDFPIDYKYYQRIEYGQKNITLKTIYKICKKLGIPPKDLFDMDID